MKTRPAMSDEEIRSFMDFDALLMQNDAQRKEERIFRNSRNVLMVIALALTITALTFLLRSQQPDPNPQVKHVVAPQSATPGDTALPDATDSLLKQDPSFVSPVEKQPKVQGSRSRPDTSRPKATAPTSKKELVYVQAEPIAGYPSLYQYFDNNLVYPEDAARDSLEGTVNVEFVIDTQGKATDILVENSLGSSFDKEAIRLVENMPEWKPATYNGQPVRSKISLPITFELQKTRNP